MLIFTALVSLIMGMMAIARYTFLALVAHFAIRAYFYNLNGRYSVTYRVISTSPSFGKFVTEPVDYLKENDCEVVLKPELSTEAELIQGLADADAWIVGVEKASDGVLSALNNLKTVAKTGAGVDNIDLAAATRLGLPVLRAPGGNSEAVAELTLGLFLSLVRCIPAAHQDVKAGQWPRIVGLELAEKTLGIVGFGQIGRKVALRASGFDMKVLAYDEYLKSEDMVDEKAELTDLNRLLDEADFISLHVPLTEETRGLIGADQLRRMKKTSVLVNVSRGGVVDEKALFNALKNGHIHSAALDVFETEPAADNPLLALDNFIATPHMGGYTRDALIKTGMVCCQGIVDILNGRKPTNIVNPDVFSK